MRPTALTVRANRFTDTAFHARIQSGARVGHPGGSGSRGFEGSWLRPGAISLVQGSKGGTRLWSWGPGESEVSSWSWSSGEALGLGGFWEGQERSF